MLHDLILKKVKNLMRYFTLIILLWCIPINTMYKKHPWISFKAFVQTFGYNYAKLIVEKLHHQIRLPQSLHNLVCTLDEPMIYNQNNQSYRLYIPDDIRKIIIDLCDFDFLKNPGACVLKKNYSKYHKGAITSLVCDQAGNKLYSASKDGSIYVWNFNNGKTHQFWNNHSPITCLTLHPTQPTLFVGRERGQIVQLCTNNHAKKKIFKGHIQAITSLAYNSATKTLFSSSNNGKIKEWDLETQRVKIDCYGSSSTCRTLVHPLTQEVYGLIPLAHRIIRIRPCVINWIRCDNQALFDPIGENLYTFKNYCTLGHDIQKWNNALKQWLPIYHLPNAIACFTIHPKTENFWVGLSDCGLQQIQINPFADLLQTHKTKSKVTTITPNPNTNGVFVGFENGDVQEIMLFDTCKPIKPHVLPLLALEQLKSRNML